MPIAKVQLPDGRIGRFDVPEGTTPEEVEAFAMETFKEQSTPIDTAQKRPGAFEGPMSVASLKQAGSAINPLEMILGAGEVATTMATGAIAEPVAGLAGMAKTITSGPDEAAKSIAEIQKALTYIPRTEEGRHIASTIGNLIKPVAEFLGQIPKAAGEAGMFVGGPAGGAAASSLVQIIPDLLGLKVAKSTKKLALKELLKDKDISKIYDSSGNIRREIKDAASNADINMDDVIKEAGLKDQAERIAKRPSEEIAVDVRPNQEIISAAEEFGVSENLLASHVSENPTFRAVEQGLKSIPGSTLAAREKALVSDLAKRADDLILEFGGEIDKTALADSYKFKAERIIEDLENRADDLYTKVSEAIPGTTLVEPDNTLELLSELAGELGGQQYMSPKERLLFKNLKPDSNPTYARLDRTRKEIGQAIGRGSGPFKDSEIGLLKRIYKAISEDQSVIADQFKVKDTFNVAKDLVATRKGIEEQLTKSLGKDITGLITTKAKSAMLNLQKGDTKQFDELLQSIPSQIGPEKRRAVIATALNDAFVQGSRKEKSLNIPGFDDFMTGLKRNKAAYKRLEAEIGAPAVKRLESFHKLTGAIRRAQSDAITTGRIMSVPKLFDETNGLASKLYGVGKTLLPEVITTSGGMPGLGTAMRVSMPKIKKASRSSAADDLLASDKFRKQMKNVTVGDISKERIDKAIKTIPQYKRWAKTLTESEAAELANLGFVEFLRNENE